MLQDILTTNIFHFMLVFSRLSVVFILFPGLSAAYIPQRVRLVAALLVAFLVLPLVEKDLPAQPATLADLAWYIVGEVLVGAFIGVLVQTIMGTLQFAG